MDDPGITIVATPQIRVSAVVKKAGVVTVETAAYTLAAAVSVFPARVEVISVTVGRPAAAANGAELIAIVANDVMVVVLTR